MGGTKNVHKIMQLAYTNGEGGCAVKAEDEKSIRLFKQSLHDGDVIVETCPNKGLDYNSKIESGVLDIYKSFYASSDFMKNLMDPVHVNKNDKFSEYIKDSFEEHIIEERYKSLLEYYRKFLSLFEDKKISNYISINTLALEHAITSYYVDTKRLKEFHQINKTNIAKVYGYMSYWLLKCKPLQVDYNKMINESFIDDIKEIKEKIITGYIINGLLAELDVNISETEGIGSFYSFSNLLSYTLKYRDVTAKCLELTISSFMAGFNLCKDLKK